MITLECGKLGMGKTYGATRQILKLLLKGRDVYANWEINPNFYIDELQKSLLFRLKLFFIWIFKLPKPQFGRLFYFDTSTSKPLSEFFTIRGSKDRTTEIFFDEAQLNVNSRDFNKIPAGFIVALSQSRHLHNNLHFIAQDPGMVDINVRRLVNEFVVFKRIYKLMWWYSYDGDVVRRWESNLPFPKREGFGFYFMKNSIIQCYNSYRDFQPQQPYARLPVWTIENYFTSKLLKGGE